MDVNAIVEAIDRELRSCGNAERAVRERVYLKSELDHLGVTVPETRAIVRSALRGTDVDHDDVIALAEALWAPPATDHARSSVRPVHERRTAATMVLIQSADHLGAGDADLVERLLREARTWALVDPLAADLVGPLSEREAGFDRILDVWAQDDDFWLRRSALLAHLVPLRQGRGDFDRFCRFADAMLEEREFFVRKAIGWVLRDTGRKRPDTVFAWLLPRAGRASAVTLREAVKHLSPEQREAILAAR
ncbi:DNA alkylation repair protein [Brevibacterium sp.]|uniref:DNA alkylation repair protein n=1 Tax=Brevibacterium sp. TaxID=1701 RepID=UPI0028126A05|nr:DNA alkylation repair protein [Brevibacterium sp.]